MIALLHGAGGRHRGHARSKVAVAGRRDPRLRREIHSRQAAPAAGEGPLPGAPAVEVEVVLDDRNLQTVLEVEVPFEEACVLGRQLDRCVSI